MRRYGPGGMLRELCAHTQGSWAALMADCSATTHLLTMMSTVLDSLLNSLAHRPLTHLTRPTDRPWLGPDSRQKAEKHSFLSCSSAPHLLCFVSLTKGAHSLGTQASGSSDPASQPLAHNMGTPIHSKVITKPKSFGFETQKSWVPPQSPHHIFDTYRGSGTHWGGPGHGVDMGSLGFWGLGLGFLGSGVQNP